MKSLQKKDTDVFRKKKILLNSSRSKKTLRLCVLCVRFYINYSVTCLFDATMLENILDKKILAKSAKTQRY